MAFIDSHCDVLSKLLQHPDSNFTDCTYLTVTLPRLKQADCMLQFFAIYIPESYTLRHGEPVLKSIDLYYERILSWPEMRLVRNRQDLIDLVPGERIGALLSLEGVDYVPNDPMYIRLLYRLGLRAIGLTWNHANWAADGATEPRGGGMTRSGRTLVKQCEQLGILIDVSHLSQRSFWDLSEMATRPFFASHSNVYEICPNPRNLTRDQIETIIEADGCIGLTFVPYFIKPAGNPDILDLLRHIEYICGMGGSFHLGFGSDFDGFDSPLHGIEHPGKYGTLRETLLKHYTEAEVDRFMYRNWHDFLYRALPC